MNTSASTKKWIAAVLSALMLFACASATAQSYRLGDEADEIATIQTALTTLKLYTASITGHYGEKTQAAVQKFQKRYALEADGIAGEDTIKALYEAAGIDAAGSSSGSSSTSSSGETVLLRHGSQNEAVRQLQNDLNKLGYYNGSISGHFGNQTQAAVMNFQRKNGLGADGIVGAKTLAKIEEKLGSSSSSSGSSGSSSSSSSSSSSTLLKHGVKNSDAVRALQQNLKALGYYKNGSVTGNFGDLTKEAVAQFQRANGLDADGIAGSKTLSKIQEKLKGSSNSSGSSGSSNPSSSSLLQLGSESDAVKTLQINLTTLGFYSGNQTGHFGDQTQAAVIAYQKSKGLTADGIAGSKTLSAIAADLKKGSSSGGSAGSGNSGSSSLADRAGQVIFSNYSNWRRNYANGELCTVYDFSTGYSWTLRIMSKDKHMDAEPATAQDTAVMNKAFGNEQTWTPKAVWVTFSDGKTYLGSTHNVPHTPYHITNNNFDGHLCVHFPRTMADAEATGNYAVWHQETILEGWEATKKLMK